MKKKILALTMLLIVLCLQGYAAEFTTANNGINGKIIVKYDNVETPLVLIEGKVMNLTITIEKTTTLSNPKMYVSLYDNGRLVNVSTTDGVDLGTEYQFQKNVQMPDDLTGHFAKVFLWENELVPTAKDLKLLTVLHSVFYTYDANNRIDTIRYFDKTITYIYDFNGNLLSRTTSTEIDNLAVLGLQNLDVQVLQKLPDNSESNKVITQPSKKDNTALKAAYVGFVDDAWITVYDLSLFSIEEVLGLEEINENE